jgi:hypothetical protein
MTKKFMTRSEFAKRRGVTAKTVSIWVRRAYVKLSPDGRVDLRASEKLLDSRPTKYRGGTRHDAARVPDLSLAESIRRREAAKAAMAELHLQRERGEFLSSSEATNTWAPLAVAFRTAHLSLHSRLAFQIPILTPADRASIEQVCRDDLEDAVLARGYFSLLKATDAADFEAELSRLRPPLLELPIRVADRLVGLAREEIRRVLHEEICKLLDTLSVPAKKQGKS